MFSRVEFGMIRRLGLLTALGFVATCQLLEMQHLMTAGAAVLNDPTASVNSSLLACVCPVWQLQVCLHCIGE